MLKETETEETIGFVANFFLSLEAFQLGGPDYDYDGYFVFGGTRTGLGVSSDLICTCGFLWFLSTEFTACSKPPSRDNHLKASLDKTLYDDYLGLVAKNKQ